MLEVAAGVAVGAPVEGDVVWTAGVDEVVVGDVIVTTVPLFNWSPISTPPMMRRMTSRMPRNTNQDGLNVAVERAEDLCKS